MVKTMYVNNANYVRKDLNRLIEGINNYEEVKKWAERRMAIYDAQPKLVRQLIGELGGLSTKFPVKLTTRQKCDYIRARNQRKLNLTSAKIIID